MIVRIARSKGNFPASVKAARGIVVAVCVGIGVWFARSVVLDLVSGPESVTLSEIQTGKSRAHSVFTQHYYLKGTDSLGETLRMEISGEDYTRLSGCSSVTATYYRNTGRIAGFQPVSDQAGETQEKRTRDEEQGRFVEEPVLSEISDPQFDAATETISGYTRAGWAGAAGEHTFYRWIDGQPTLIRRVWTDVEPAEAGGEDTLTLAVEDRRDGVLTEVFRQTYPLEGGGWLDARAQWLDLNYPDI